jgi:hypothetical protein
VVIAIVVLGAVWWFRSGRAARAQVSGRLSQLAFLPSLSRMSKAGRMASFADVLRLLVEHRVPLPEALSLAGDATGDRRLAAGARQMAEQIARGDDRASSGAAGAASRLSWPGSCTAGRPRSSSSPPWTIYRGPIAIRRIRWRSGSRCICR